MTLEQSIVKPADAVTDDWVAAGACAYPALSAASCGSTGRSGRGLLFWPCALGLLLGATEGDRPFAGWRDLWLIVLFGVGRAS